MDKSIMLYQEMISPSPDYKKSETCQSKEVQLYSCSDHGGIPEEILAYCGYQEVGMAGRYGVFRFEKPDGA